VQLTEALEQERLYLGQPHTSGVVTGFGPGVAGSVHVTEAAEDKWGEMLDNFFDYRNPARKGKVVQSFKECYIQMTGDMRVTGRLREAVNVRNLSLRESILSTTWDQALADSLNRQLVRDYMRMDLTKWRLVVDVVPAGDFRTRHRPRIGGYANLATVAQQAPYPSLASPTDEEATYAVAKHGGTEELTLEAIRNDDVGAVRLIPLRMARAAAQTLHEFVFDFFANNAAIYDTVALFHATHGNLSSTALGTDGAQYLIHRQKMRDQVEAASSKPLGLTPAYLLIPNELESSAYNTFNRDTNNDPKLVQTQGVKPMETIVLDYWTDANNWFTVVNPQQCPTIEIAFLDGKEEPETFVQDMPQVGSMFTNDVRTYKIRHVYGGAVVDYRGMQAAIVA
jgi:hypothetical protein